MFHKENDLGYLFVYGTLKIGEYFGSMEFFNYRRIWRGSATIKGTMFDAGGFPGVILDRKGVVHGELHLYKEFELVVRQCDIIEMHTPGNHSRSLYIRREMEVDAGDGKIVDAVVYEYNLEREVVGRNFVEKRIITSGNWTQMEATI